MRIQLAAATALLLSACVRAPGPVQPQVPQLPPSEHTRGAVIGLTAQELVRRFGNPALQIGEGDGIKLQFRSSVCVLDAYLYQSGNAPHRVTYVDTRNRAMADVDQASCIASFASR